MRNSDFDMDSLYFGLFIDSLYFGLFIGTLLGVIITAVAVNYGSGKQRQSECKELNGIQICRDIDYFPWKVKEDK